MLTRSRTKRSSDQADPDAKRTKTHEVKSDQADQGSNRSKTQEVGPDNLGVNDHFSRLPGDCLLDVFKRVDRMTIFNVSSLSKRMSEITANPSIDCVKWEGGHLEIKMTRKGYGFNFSIGEEEDYFSMGRKKKESRIKYPWKGGDVVREAIRKKHFRFYGTILYSYNYEVIRTKTGIVKETKKVNSYLEDAPDDLPAHDWPVPDELFDAIKEIGRQHNITGIKLTEIPLDAVLFEKLLSVIDGHRVEKFKTDDTCEEKVNDEMRNSFIKFMKNIDSVRFERSYFLLSMLNEEFFNQLGDSKLPTRLTFKDWSKSAAYKYRFTPSENLFPKLLRWRHLHAPHMVLKVDTVLKLVLMYMDTIENPTENKDCGRWRIASDRPLTTEVFDRGVPEEGFEYNGVRFGREVYMMRERDRLQANFCLDEQILDDEGENAVFNSIIVTFSKRRLPWY